VVAGAGVGLDYEAGDAVVDSEYEFLASGFEAGFVACYAGWSACVSYCSVTET
jgi:hypothetical protein